MKVRISCLVCAHHLFGSLCGKHEGIYGYGTALVCIARSRALLVCSKIVKGIVKGTFVYGPGVFFSLVILRELLLEELMAVYSGDLLESSLQRCTSRGLQLED